MYRIQTKTFGQVAVATLLSLGLSAGVVSVASATTHSNKALSHFSIKSHKTVAFQGAVTALPAGGVTVTNAKGTSETFTITTTTTMLRASNVKTSAVLAVSDRVEVRALASAPTVATSINILAVKARKSVAFRGVVTAVPAGFVTITNAKGTSETFTITTTTKMLGAPNALTLAVNDRVEVRAWASAPTVVTSINILGAKK
jgi:hypothetical protein